MNEQQLGLQHIYICNWSIPDHIWHVRLLFHYDMHMLWKKII